MCFFMWGHSSPKSAHFTKCIQSVHNSCDVKCRDNIIVTDNSNDADSDYNMGHYVRDTEA